MLTVTDEAGREWVAVGFDWTTGDFTWVPADTEVIRAPAYPQEDEPAEEQQLQLPGLEGDA